MTTSLINYLPKNFLSDQPNLKAVLDAIAIGDRSVIDLLTSARRQFFLISAEGRYLTNLANQYGFAVRPNSGLDQEDFRRLSQPAIWAPKQSIPTLNKIAEIFYTTSVLHPTISSSVLEPYSLVDDDNLSFATEDTEISITFSASKFSDITRISAAEIASTINSQSRGLLFADTVLDKTTNKSYVRVSSLNFGSGATIRCSGGTAQNILKFQQVKDVFGFSGTTWNITKLGDVNYSNVVRFTWDGTGTDPRLFNLDFGDTITIRGLESDGITDFSLLNGSYSVLDVGPDYFEFRTTKFPYSSGTLIQADENQICFTSKLPRSLFDNEQYAIVSETSPGILDISVPAIPPIIRSSLRGASRLRGEVLPFIRYEQSKIVVPYPNNLPDSGTVMLNSDRFELGFENRYIKYSSKLLPVGDEQVLNVEKDIGYSGVPFISAAEADIGLSIIPERNPILGTVDSPDILIDTPNVPHFFENAQEITIENASIDIEVSKYKVVPGIYCPAGQDYVVFEHDMESQLLYMQFIDENTKEQMHLLYEPDFATDPDNRTRIKYLPIMEGRFLRAIIINIAPGSVLGDPTSALGPFPMNSSESVNIPFLFGSQFSTFQPLDSSDKHKITGVRLINDPNSSDFSFGFPNGSDNFHALGVDYQEIFPGLVRAVSVDFPLPASVTSENTVSLVHNLFCSSLIVELRVKDPGTTGLPANSLIEFFKIILVNDTELQIKYNNLSDDITVDIFIIAAFFNPMESIHGGILPSQLNSRHVVRRRVDSEKYEFRILGTGPAPLGSGTITTSGKTVSGVGTLFTSEVNPGDFICSTDNQKREVDFILSDTQLELKQGFNPSIGIPTIYKIISPENNDTPQGEYVKFEGAVVFGFNVVYSPDPARGTDIRFEFPDRTSRQKAGFIDGTAVTIVPGFGFDIENALATYVRNIRLTVHSQDQQYVYFNVGIGGVPGNIIQNAKCFRSGYYGGDAFVHYLAHPLSEYNRQSWFKNAQVRLLDTNLPPNDQYVGSYIYDAEGKIFPFSVGALSTTLLEGVSKFSAPGTLMVSDISSWPNSGYLFIDFGNDRFEGPIRYRLKIIGTPSELIIDPAYIFKQDHRDNAIVRIAASVTRTELLTDASQYPAYLTGSVEARKTLEDILRELVSVGVKLNLEIQLPELRFFEKSMQPFL